MARIEHVREVLQRPLDLVYLMQRAEAGWKLVALEWERKIEGEEPQPAPPMEEVPYGLQVAADCSHLEENLTEMQTLKLIMEFVVQDISLPQMAQELNRAGFRTREGREWGPVSVFRIFPRVIDISPRIFSSEEWAVRRKQLAHVAWNS
jgi:hypothetical protein